MWRQSGNSIAVNVIKEVIRSVIATGVFEEKGEDNNIE